MFISRDTYLDQLPYGYCDGDPVNAVDPSGHSAVGNMVANVLGVIGGLLTAVPKPSPPPTITTVITNPTKLLGGIIEYGGGSTTVVEAAAGGEAAVGIAAAAPVVGVIILIGVGIYYGNQLGNYLGNKYYGPGTY
jgi:hypothetical protein